MGYRFFAGGMVYDLLLRGTNLTGEEARNHVSFLKDRVPLPGRDVSLAVESTFESPPPYPQVAATATGRMHVQLVSGLGLLVLLGIAGRCRTTGVRFPGAR